MALPADAVIDDGVFESELTGPVQLEGHQNLDPPPGVFLWRRYDRARQGTHSLGRHLDDRVEDGRNDRDDEHGQADNA